MTQSVLSKINRGLYYFAAFVPFFWGFWTFHHFELTSGFDQMLDHIDPRFHICQFENYFQALLGHTGVISPPYFYPIKGVLGYTDAMAGVAPVYCFFRLIHLDMYNATQAALLTFDILNFAACFWFLKKAFNLSIFSASVGAAFFTFNSVKFNQLNHYDFQALYFFPLVFLCLVGVVRNLHQSSKKKRGLWVAAILLDIQFLTSFYMGWFFVMWSICLILLLVIFRWRDIMKKFPGAIFTRFDFNVWVAGFIFVTGLIPFFALYLPVLHLKGPRELFYINGNMPTYKAFFWMGDGNYIWGWLSKFKAIGNMDCQWENRLGLGLLFSLFWIFVTAKAVLNIPALIHQKLPAFPFEKNSSIKNRSVFETLVVLSVWACLIVIMKYHGHTMFWRLIYNFVPGGKAVLCTSRFAIFLMLPVSMILSFEVQRWILHVSILKDPAKKTGIILLMGFALSGIWLEQMGTSPFPVFSVSQDRQRIVALAGQIPSDATAFYVSGFPGDDDAQKDAMLISAVSGIPTINGASSSPPPGWNLENVSGPDYQKNVSKWIMDHQLGSKVFDLKFKKED